MRSGLIPALLFSVVLGFTITGSGRATAAVQGAPTYRPPVDGEVIDPFRPPEHDWLPGNRGVDYETHPGEMIAAIAPGVVTFAGQVGGPLHITVTHPDGLRSSYSFVAAIRVQQGDRVEGGDPVAVAGEEFHLGVREGDRYIDPTSLWGRAVGGGEVRLVPTDSSRSSELRLEGGPPAAGARYGADPRPPIPGALAASLGHILHRAADIGGSA